MITAEQFKAATGYEPQMDDLERCNCPQQGEVYHRQCGWCYVSNLPVFMCTTHEGPHQLMKPEQL